MMGPALVQAVKAGTFDGAAWAAAEQAADARTFDETLAAIAAQTDAYAALLADVSDDDLRAEIDPFGAESRARGAFMVNRCSAAARPTARSCSCTSRRAAAKS